MAGRSSGQYLASHPSWYRKQNGFLLAAIIVAIIITLKTVLLPTQEFVRIRYLAAALSSS
ncbi:MAG: hypothetical protein WBZ36_07050 [Candidatus Nitrosopolaris sp.]